MKKLTVEQSYLDNLIDDRNKLLRAAKMALKVLEAHTPKPSPTRENSQWYLAESMLRAAIKESEVAR